jgi:hypothetical protein
MFGIATPLQFYQKLVQEFDDFCENPGSARHAMNFVITAYHLHEWVWKGFLKNDAAKRQELGIAKDIGAFKVWLDNRSIWYAQMQNLANGSKHFQDGSGIKIRMLHMGPLNTMAFNEQPPLFVQTIFGVLGGQGADLENLAHCKRIADKLFGDECRWSVMATGRHQLPFVRSAALMGGNIRVGLEDSLFIGKGRLANSNAEQVAAIRATLERLSVEIATPAEAREMLLLKGAENVGF